MHPLVRECYKPRDVGDGITHGHDAPIEQDQAQAGAELQLIIKDHTVRHHQGQGHQRKPVRPDIVAQGNHIGADRITQARGRKVDSRASCSHKLRSRAVSC